MTPFPIPEVAPRLVDHHPDSRTLSEVLLALPAHEHDSFVRLWITEGIPHAFRDAPLAYEHVRRYVARQLQVHEKDITLVGSARSGYSLAPVPEYGRAFSNRSDLDLSIVSDSLFSTLGTEAQKWMDDFDGGLTAETPARQAYWRENRFVVPRNLHRGFIDAYLFNYRRQYPTADAVIQTCWRTKEKLNVSPHAPTVRRVSIRTFRDWSAFMQQATLNLRYTLNSLRLAGQPAPT